MYTFAQQSLDNHITGNWGEDDCAPEPVDEVKAITEQLSSFINILIVDGDDVDVSAEAYAELVKAHQALKKAHDLML
jgi:hypothetical protein